MENKELLSLIYSVLEKKKKKVNVPWKEHKTHRDNVLEPGQAFLF